MGTCFWGAPWAAKGKDPFGDKHFVEATKKGLLKLSGAADMQTPIHINQLAFANLTVSDVCKI